MDKLKACPFCRGVAARPAREGTDQFVTCGACGARGPRKTTPEDAATAWNTRRGGDAGAARPRAPDDPAPEDPPEAAATGPIPLLGGDLAEPDKA
jgi:hypothetical protein